MQTEDNYYHGDMPTNFYCL